MRFFTFIIFTLFSLPSFANAATQLKLSLGEAVRIAAEKNLDVRAELYNPAQLEADINRNKGIYDPLFNAQTSYGESNTPAEVGASGTSRRFQFNSSLSQLLWTGGTAAIIFDNQFTSNGLTPLLSDYWQSNLGVSINQPLLKNMGKENTEINISIARLSKFASLERFNTVLTNTIAQVRSEYFKLYDLREQLQVRKVSLELAKKILTETKARVDAGVLPAMEIINAEFGATTRERDLIDTERGVSDQMDVLRKLLQLDTDTEIVPTDIPRNAKIQPDENESIRLAMSRPDIREQKRNLEIAELQTRVLNNKTKPDLSFIASASTTGLEHTYQRSLDKMATFDYPVWSVGLSFSYPLGNRAANNDYRKSRLKTEQEAIQIKNLEAAAANDVKSAIRAIFSGYKQLDVADRGRAYAEERLKSFTRKAEVGLATTKDVLDVENDLATAKSNQITARVNYDNAITRLWQVTGELLEREGVHLVEDDADRLYKDVR